MEVLDNLVRIHQLKIEPASVSNPAADLHAQPCRSI